MNLLTELVVMLLALPGVSEVLRRRQVTMEYVVDRLTEVAKAVESIDCKDECEKKLLISLLGKNIADVVIPGSTMNVPQMVKEVHEEVHGLLVLIKQKTEPVVEDVVEDPEPETPQGNGEGNQGEPEPPVKDPVEPKAEDTKLTVDDVRNASISELQLETRARNAYITEGTTTIGAIVDYSKAKPLSEIKGIGDAMASDTLDAIKAYAEKNGVSFDEL